MSGVAVVAVPAKTDSVWSISSEKIPHMTLLYLGDALDKEYYQHVQEFIEHVADTMLYRFGMVVDKRGVLGKDEADVLFFKNENKSNVSLFRKYLLQDSKIREAYESIEQFEGWTPHLTLGYPDSPAKKDEQEAGDLYFISFDRIMFWTGEYSGPEIELKDEDLSVAMSNLEEVEDFLAHVGVKGMKWGVRKSREERRSDRTKRIQERSKKAIAKEKQLTARANAKAAVAKAKTKTADARTSAATAKLETKVAKKETEFSKTEARKGIDDPANGMLRQPLPDKPQSPGIVGRTNKEAKGLRGDAVKNARTLDDKTLKSYTERLNTEKQLKNAVKEDVKPGRAAANKLISDAGKDIAKTALIGAGSMLVYAVLAKKFPGAATQMTKKGTGPAKGSSVSTAIDAAEKMASAKVPTSKMPPAMKWKSSLPPPPPRPKIKNPYAGLPNPPTSKLLFPKGVKL